MHVLIIPGIIVVLILVLLVRTFNFRSAKTTAQGERTEVGGEISDGASKLAEAVKVETVSHMEASMTDWNEFIRFQDLLEKLFPDFHRVCEKTVIRDYSLVYRWKGAGSGKKPCLVTAHIDVVPVEKGTEKDWEYPPFSGEIAEGFVWGRGTLDTKIHLIASLEAAEQLIREGFIPDRDIYFAFGHDEEVGGFEGASRIVEHFKNAGIEFEFMLDEGGCITDGVVEGVGKPVALIGTGEKGFANIKLTFRGEGGHSSTPPLHSALGLAAQAVNRLEKRQCRLKLIEPIRVFLMKLGPEMEFANRLVLANLWLFKPLFLAVFSKTKNGNAMLRTTTAATMAEASQAPNVLPQKASVIVNFRILPGETGHDLIAHIKETVKGMETEIEPLILDEPSLVSSSDSRAFKTIAGITEQLCKDAVVAPYIVLASTDARKYEALCGDVYRFTPYRIDALDMARVHGTNERISLKNVNMCVQFFRLFFQDVK